MCILFFVSSRRRHTRCALVTGVQTCALPISKNSVKTLEIPGNRGWMVISLGEVDRQPQGYRAGTRRCDRAAAWACLRQRAGVRARRRGQTARQGPDRDRKRVVSGKSVSVRVDIGGRRIIRKKKQNTQM